MKSPSPRALSSRVSLYRAVVVQDEDGGAAVTYGDATAADVPCSVQPAGPERLVDPVTGRLVEKTLYDVVFRDDHALRADDRVVWVDHAGVSHNLYVRGSADQAGRGACIVVSTEERT